MCRLTRAFATYIHFNNKDVDQNLASKLHCVRMEIIACFCQYVKSTTILSAGQIFI